MSKSGASQNAAGMWRGNVEVTHVDPSEAVRLTVELATVLNAQLVELNAAQSNGGAK